MMGLGVGGGCGVGLGLGWGIGLGWGSKYINQHFVFEETTRSKRAVDSPQVRFEGLLFARIFRKAESKERTKPAQS